jgi:undecaprenyl-diphosphatase
MSFFEALIIAIVEGLTEFLPISSTGHMIITQTLLGIEINEFVKLFTISIQFGAILSVVFLYWKRFFKNIRFYINLIIAIIPAAVLSIILKKYIDRALGDVSIVAINLLVGGFIMIGLDYWFKQKDLHKSEVTLLDSLKIGFFQALAMFPGVSRSAATIYGGMLQGYSKQSAAEFSFFLAVPTMFLATVKDLYDFYKAGQTALTSYEINLLLFGNIISFLVAMVAIKFFIQYIVKHNFFWFGVYRILVGATILIMISKGISLVVVE